MFPTITLPVCHFYALCLVLQLSRVIPCPGPLPQCLSSRPGMLYLIYIRHISFPVPYFCPTGLSSILRYLVLSVGFRAPFHLPRSLVYKHLHGSCLHAHPRLVLFPGPKLRPSAIASCLRTIRMCVLYAVPYSAVNLTGMCAFRLRMLRRSCGSSSALQAVNGGWKSMIAHHRLAAESSMDVFFLQAE